MKRKLSNIFLLLLAIVFVLPSCQQCPEYIECEVCQEGYPITTILILRHADRINDNLSHDGCLRANELVHVTGKAGVDAIFTSTATRAKQTVKPLALALELDPIEYDYDGYPDTTAIGNQYVVDQINQNYIGKSVLVVGHTDNIPSIINLLGGDSSKCQVSSEYDNLCILTLSGSSVNVTNLQYGAPSGPEFTPPPCPRIPPTFYP